MTVIAIMAIISATTIPGFFSTERRAKKVARELMGNMQKARILAVKTNSNVSIVFDTNLLDGTPTPRYLISTGGVTVATIQFTDHGAGVQYLDGSGGGAGPVTYGSNVLTFNPSGTCGAGFVYISIGGSSFRIGTLSTGIIRIHRWNGGSYS